MNPNQEKNFEATNTLWPFLKRLFGLAIKNHPKLFSILAIGVLITAVADALLPKLFYILLDKLVIPQVKIYTDFLEKGIVYTPKIEIFIPYIVMYAVWIASITFSVWLFILGAQQLQERLMYDLRKQMFNKLQYLSFSFYDKNALGWLVSRITSDTNRVTEIISWGFVSVVWGSSMIIFTFFVMMTIDLELTLWVMATLPLLAFVSIKIRLLILKNSRKARKQGSENIAYFIEHINGIEVNKSTVQEEKATKVFLTKTELQRKYSFKSSYYTAMFIPVVIVVGSLAAVLVIWQGGSKVLDEKTLFLIPSLAAFFIASRSIFEPIFDISRFYAMAQDSLAAGERIFSLIDEKIDIHDNNKQAFETLKGAIEFKDVDFYYNKEKPILTKFNLKINSGESIALVGPTGHGKTTITSLINRFYEPINGNILFDNIDYKTRTLHSLRKQMGVILQSPHLFSGTIKENIIFGLENVSEKDVIETLKQIGALNLIEKLNLEVGEEGTNLSNGERQLVSFARAIIKKPAILIMDEATSSIDTITEAKIQKGINEIIKGRTSIIIAHRLSTIKKCDRIIVIENGGIKEIGNHDELLAKKGHYFNLYEGQKI